MKKWTLDDIAIVEFIFENMEHIRFRKEEFKSFKLTEDGEMNLEILGSGEYVDQCEDLLVPVQRIPAYNDIVTVRLLTSNYEIIDIETMWYSGDDDNEYDRTYESENAYQKTTAKLWNNVVVSISKKNKLFDVKEVLSSKQGTCFIDEVGIKYETGHGTLFLWGDDEPVPLTLEILGAKFYIQ